MNERQSRALELMRADPKSIGYDRRDIYEGADGQYRITYTGGIEYPPLTQQDVDELERDGLISKQWPGLYALVMKGRA